MTKFFGVVGYGEQVEKSPGVWLDEIVELEAYGDITRSSRTLSQGESVNDNLTLNNTIRIVMDAYSSEHFHAIRYVQWAGARWKVVEVTDQRPRLLLRLGGVYNGPIPDPVTP